MPAPAKSQLYQPFLKQLQSSLPLGPTFTGADHGIIADWIMSQFSLSHGLEKFQGKILSEKMPWLKKTTSKIAKVEGPTWPIQNVTKCPDTLLASGSGVALLVSAANKMSNQLSTQCPTSPSRLQCKRCKWLHPVWHSAAACPAVSKWPVATVPSFHIPWWWHCRWICPWTPQIDSYPHRGPRISAVRRLWYKLWCTCCRSLHLSSPGSTPSFSSNESLLAILEHAQQLQCWHWNEMCWLAVAAPPFLASLQLHWLLPLAGTVQPSPDSMPCPMFEAWALGPVDSRKKWLAQIQIKSTKKKKHITYFIVWYVCNVM